MKKKVAEKGKGSLAARGQAFFSLGAERIAKIKALAERRGLGRSELTKRFMDRYWQDFEKSEA